MENDRDLFKHPVCKRNDMAISLIHTQIKMAFHTAYSNVPYAKLAF